MILARYLLTILVIVMMMEVVRKNWRDLQLPTTKPFRRGEQYCKSGYVTEMMDTKKDSVYMVKSMVKSSMKQKHYKVICSISADSGVIKNGICECPQASLSRCSHIMAVLRQVLKHIDLFGTAAMTGKHEHVTTSVGYRSEK